MKYAKHESTKHFQNLTILKRIKIMSNKTLNKHNGFIGKCLDINHFKKPIASLLVISLLAGNACYGDGVNNGSNPPSSSNPITLLHKTAGNNEQVQGKGVMVLIEGLDLAGKSTLTRNLVKQLKDDGYSVSYSKNALVPNNPIALKADILRKEADAGLLESGALFLAAHLYDIKTFQYPVKHTVHVQDSSWLRTSAYHSLHNTRWIPEFLKNISIYQPKFDVVIYLTASSKVRRQRVLQREIESGENDKADYMAWFNPEKVEKHDRLLLEKTLEYYPHAHKIDTSNISAQQVKGKVLELIQSHLKDINTNSKK